jgi:hypothetical protein
MFQAWCQICARVDEDVLEQMVITKHMAELTKEEFVVLLVMES